MIPASTQVLNEIDTRLSRIKTSNGFALSIKKVNRSKRTKFSYSELPAINYYSSGDVIEKAYGVETHSLSISLEYHDRKTIDDTTFNNISAIQGAEMVKALLLNSSGVESANLGDLVDSISITSTTPLIDKRDLPYCGTAIDLIIQYKTPILDHYTIL